MGMTHLFFFAFCIISKLELVNMSLKASFNNVFTFKNLSCMALHAINVFDKV